MTQASTTKFMIFMTDFSFVQSSFEKVTCKKKNYMLYEVFSESNCSTGWVYIQFLIDLNVYCLAHYCPENHE